MSTVMYVQDGEIIRENISECLNYDICAKYLNRVINIYSHGPVTKKLIERCYNILHLVLDKSEKIIPNSSDNWEKKRKDRTNTKKSLKRGQLCKEYINYLLNSNAEEVMFQCFDADGVYDDYYISKISKMDVQTRLKLSHVIFYLHEMLFNVTAYKNFCTYWENTPNHEMCRNAFIDSIPVILPKDIIDVIFLLA